MVRNYNRIFVTLKQERSDYSLPSRQSLGRCIIESKGDSGKLAVYVQDIKPQVLYKVYLIAGDLHESKGVQAGTLVVDAKGKGELKWEFDANSVGGSGIPIEKFNVVAVIAPRSSEIVSVLSGFTAGEMMWKNNFVDWRERAEAAQEAKQNTKQALEQEAKPEAKPQQVFEEVVVAVAEAQPEPEPELTPQSEPQPEPEPEPEFTPQSEPEFTPQPESETWQQEEPVSKKEALHTKSPDFFDEELDLSATHEAFRKVIKELDEKMEGLLGMDYVFANHVEMNPFAEENSKIKWARITWKDLILFDENCISYMNHPFIIYNYHKYKHFMMGEFFDENQKKRHILAVPDAYDTKYKNVAESLGFHDFKFSNGEYGYWLKQ